VLRQGIRMKKCSARSCGRAFGRKKTEQILLQLDKCPACEQRLEDLEPLLGLCRDRRITDLPESPAWRDLSSAMDSIDHKPLTRAPRRAPRKAWMGAVAAGAAICAFLLCHQPSGGTTRGNTFAPGRKISAN
jgi:hypothetical protein